MAEMTLQYLRDRDMNILSMNVKWPTVLFSRYFYTSQQLYIPLGLLPLLFIHSLQFLKKNHGVLSDATLTSIFSSVTPSYSISIIISRTVSSYTDLILSQSFFFSFVEGIIQ